MKRIVLFVVSIVVMVLLVWVVFRGTDWSMVREAMRQVRWGWLLAAQAAIWISFFTRIRRWSYIVRAVHPASFRHMFSATQIGFLTNFTVNLRLGEFVRGLVLARLTRMSFSKSMALATLDRVTDLVGLAIILFIAAVSFHPQGVLPAGIAWNKEPIEISEGFVRTGAFGAAAASAGIVAILVLLYVNQNLVLRIAHRVIGLVSARLERLACGMLEQFADGLHVFRSTGDMVRSIGWSLVTWAMFMVALASFLNAFGLNWPWYAAFAIQALLALAISLPGTPGLVGQFHAPVVIGVLLSVPGDMDEIAATAKAMAIVMHLSNLFAVTALGVLCLYMEKLNFVQLTREGAKAQDAAHHHDAQPDSGADAE
jgi:glycosyltransferase 2 family protein